jgi:hypothetical protein
MLLFQSTEHYLNQGYIFLNYPAICYQFRTLTLIGTTITPTSQVCTCIIPCCKRPACCEMLCMISDLYGFFRTPQL